ncbi:unnamed protein product [Rotaria sp. Silwood2]|nr:unnamed protein product [Rotaria sp. Silwood2]CAF3054730.1 unnamed protein product [Rotaria sp. Silwood2]CAF4088016.1 unnamed protein product [Rotaria sp. Silwood2]CAF4162867.1 unnamed protein product [Rotaria sp. Silwood2]
MASTISNDRVSNKLIIEDLDLKGKCVLIRVDFNGQILDKAKTKHFEIYLQIDFIVANDYLDLDIGQQLIEKPFCEAIKQAKTIIWNYSTGVFEHDQFANGTQKKYLRLLLNKPNNIL